LFCFHISSLLARSQTLGKTARTKNRLGGINQQVIP
jgi:hypothetical protein